jgi:nicotinamidase-related amidase
MKDKKMIRPTTLRHRRIVIDIDTQRHFFLNDSKACVRNNQHVLANIRRVIAWTRLRHIPVVSTVQISSHNAFCCGFFWANAKRLRKINCTLRSIRLSLDATTRTDFRKDLFEQFDQVILPKRRFDPFEEPQVDRVLTELDADEFILVGALTEGAVRATAIGLLARQKNVTVLADATGSIYRKSGKVALRHMRAKGARMNNTETLLGHSYMSYVKAC